MSNWRQHPLFVYGYLPIRFIFLGAGIVAAYILAACYVMLWFEPKMFKQVLRKALY